MDILEKLIKVQIDAAQFGLDYVDTFQILNQIIDECREIKEDLEQGVSPEKLQEEIGDVLHAAIYLCVYSQFNVQHTLEKTNLKFEKRMNHLKKLAYEKGLVTLQGQNIKYILELWESIKNKP